LEDATGSSAANAAAQIRIDRPDPNNNRSMIFFD
jgi:hypothetical protein